MPTYEYLCGKCGKFEEMQSIKAPALAECPVCHGPVTRIISGGSGLIFKGSGFYLTDNRNAEYKAKEQSDKAPPPPVSKDATSSVTTGKKAETPPAGKPAETTQVKPPSTGDSGAKSSPVNEAKP